MKPFKTLTHCPICGAALTTTVTDQSKVIHFLFWDIAIRKSKVMQYCSGNYHYHYLRTWHTKKHSKKH